MDIDRGFDRGVDFKQKKDELIKRYEETVKEINNLNIDQRYYISKRRKLIHRLIYLMVAMTQLINGSRISEACEGFKKFLETKNFKSKIIVKIAKSESIKYKKDTHEKFKTKARFRHLIFPLKWFIIDDSQKDDIDFYINNIKVDVLKKRVLDYLLKHHECNTHSLRYAYINYMLYTENKPPSLIAKAVGHSNMNQLVTYTQKKESDKLLEMDI